MKDFLTQLDGELYTSSKGKYPHVKLQIQRLQQSRRAPLNLFIHRTVESTGVRTERGRKATASTSLLLVRLCQDNETFS